MGSRQESGSDKIVDNDDDDDDDELENGAEKDVG